MARLKLLLKAYLFRGLQRIATILDVRFSHPLPPSHDFKRKIPCTVGSHPGNIDLLFYTSTSYKNSTTKRDVKETKGRHPILINFHGGGFTIGNAGDDARWAAAITQETDAVVVSVDYRRAPEYPFPTGIEDCVSAVLWLWEHAEELGLDTDRTAFSGFSAGGNFTYAVAIRLYEELEKLRGADRDRDVKGKGKGKLIALASFYPSTDWTKTRAERDATNANLIPVIPETAYRLFDESYLHPLPKDMSHPLLSPGLASDELLKAALPKNMVLITCAGDQLLAEGQAFRARLEGLSGFRIQGFVVDGVGHAWDKRPSFKKGDEKRDRAYEVAVGSLKEAWAVETGEA